MGSKKGVLCKFGSGALGLSVDPNAIWAAGGYLSSRCTWCSLLKTGIAVPNTFTFAEEPIQEFHYFFVNSDFEFDLEA